LRPQSPMGGLSLRTVHSGRGPRQSASAQLLSNRTRSPRDSRPSVGQGRTAIPCTA
jgi:hypothetical protein